MATLLLLRWTKLLQLRERWRKCIQALRSTAHTGTRQSVMAEHQERGNDVVILRQGLNKTLILDTPFHMDKLVLGTLVWRGQRRTHLLNSMWKVPSPMDCWTEPGLCLRLFVSPNLNFKGRFKTPELQNSPLMQKNEGECLIALFFALVALTGHYGDSFMENRNPFTLQRPGPVSRSTARHFLTHTSTWGKNPATGASCCHCLFSCHFQGCGQWYERAPIVPSLYGHK